jgi:hypothetical protein
MGPQWPPKADVPALPPAPPLPLVPAPELPEEALPPPPEALPPCALPDVELPDDPAVPTALPPLPPLPLGPSSSPPQPAARVSKSANAEAARSPGANEDSVERRVFMVVAAA